MKHSNNLFAAFERRFNLVGVKWAAWMSKKESTASNNFKKLCLLAFVILMISLLWLPFVLKSKTPVVDVGSINPPVSLDRSEYQKEVRRMDYLIDSIQSSSLKSKRKDTLQQQMKLNTDTLK